MKVGVLSDSHLKIGDKPGPVQLIIERHFTDCSAILHAGDLAHLDHFFSIIPEGVRFYAVAGNMDDSYTSEQLPVKRIVTLAGAKIGLIHGYGAPSAVMLNAAREFTGDQVDAIVFGHSHMPCNRIVDDVLMFNPGSPTDKRFAPNCSIGILHIGDKVTGQIIRLGGES